MYLFLFCILFSIDLFFSFVHNFVLSSLLSFEYLALLLSALKARSIPYTPAAIKRTIEATAIPLGSHDAFSIGQGLLQVHIHTHINIQHMCVCM